ncbi:MAG: ABC transporter permease, partial [Dehalococcoidia bacterium]|nr:ABC transporter permease [Dehalococcoidia bacterium]
TVHRLRRVQYTFDATTLLQANAGVRWRDSTTAIQRDGLLWAIAGVPGVRDVAFEGYAPTRGGALTAEMVAGDSDRTVSAQNYSRVSWNYLRVHGLPILKGRDFEPGDADGHGVAILNPAAAERFYPRQEAVGRMLKLGAPAREAPWIPIVGVARNPMALREDEERRLQPSVWVVSGDHRVRFGWLLIRTASDDPRVAVGVRRVMHTLRGLWYSSVERYTSGRDAELASRVFLADVFVAMGAVALGLAALGLYGVLSYAVNQRMREFAVRIALGAEPRQLFRMVMHDGFVMLLAGIGVGAFGALTASKLLDAVLTNVLPSDVVSLVACEAVLVVVGLAAALSPARRAVRANPLDILRSV